MLQRVFWRPDGTVIVTTFAPNARRKEKTQARYNEGELRYNTDGSPVMEEHYAETWIEFMDRCTQKLSHKNLPYVDIPIGTLPPKVLSDGKCGRCRWRIEPFGRDEWRVAVDVKAICNCGRDEMISIKSKIKSTDQAIAIQGLLELERFKIRQQEKTNGLNPAPNPQSVTATGDGSPPA